MSIGRGSQDGFWVAWLKDPWEMAGCRMGWHR